MLLVYRGTSSSPRWRRGRSIMPEFEGDLISSSFSAIPTARRVFLPPIRDGAKVCDPGEALLHPELRDMKTMVEAAGDHREASAGVFVERPVPGIVALERGLEGAIACGEQGGGTLVGSGKHKVINTP